MKKLLLAKKQIVIFTIIFCLIGTVAIWQSSTVLGSSKAEKKEAKKADQLQKKEQRKAVRQQAATQQSTPNNNHHHSPSQTSQAASALDFKSTISKIYKGEAITLSWSSQTARSCSGSGTYQGEVLVGSSGQRQKWIGPQTPASSVRTMPLDGSHTFSLTCSGTKSVQTQTVDVTLDATKPNDKAMGVFDQGCPYSHSLPDDPIVFPNQPGRSHMHDFFGFKHTNAFSNFDKMRPTITANSTPTTCTEFGKNHTPAPNASGYWTPALYLNGRKVNPANAHVYYKGGNHRKTAAFPPGFRMIAGNAHATLEEAKKAGVTKYWCGAHDQPRVGEIPPDCLGSKSIIAEVGFPVCWNGQLDSTNHQSHMAYAKKGCPSTHSMKLPRIVLNIRYEVFNQTGKHLNPATDKIQLASGGMWTMHADYLFAWDQSRLDFLAHECLNKKVDTSGGQGHQRDCKHNPPLGP